jgi:hypothetical protein
MPTLKYLKDGASPSPLGVAISTTQPACGTLLGGHCCCHCGRAGGPGRAARLERPPKGADPLCGWAGANRRPALTRGPCGLLEQRICGCGVPTSSFRPAERRCAIRGRAHLAAGRRASWPAARLMLIEKSFSPSPVHQLQPARRSLLHHLVSLNRRGPLGAMQAKYFGRHRLAHGRCVSGGRKHLRRLVPTKSTSTGVQNP